MDYQNTAVTENTETLTEKQAAEIIGISPKTLRNWRVAGVGPIFFRAGTRLVRYRRGDVAAWCSARLAHSTSGSQQPSDHFRKEAAQ